MFVPDTMVCTGCCSSLDHIVTYLFKQLSRSTKKRPTPMATDDRFLHIMQQHPEMIQQVRDQLSFFLNPPPPSYHFLEINLMCDEAAFTSNLTLPRKQAGLTDQLSPVVRRVVLVSDQTCDMQTAATKELSQAHRQAHLLDKSRDHHRIWCERGLAPTTRQLSRTLFNHFLNF